MISSLMANGMTRGLTLQEMVKLSLRAANSYSRSSTDNAVQRDHIHKRMSVETWVVIGTFLVSCLKKVSEHSKNWTNTDPLRDFTSTAWTDLEQQGATSFIAAEVAIAQDLESEDQMRGARTALQEVANDTADHLGLLIQVNEQIHIHEQAMEQWMKLHRDETGISLEN